MGSRRFGKTRYGHVFSKGRHSSNIGFDTIYRGEPVPNMFMGVETETSVTSDPKFPTPTPFLAFGDLIRRKQALRYGCPDCQGAPRQVSPHEGSARFGYDMRITEVRDALRARCRSGTKCGLQLEPDNAPWNPYG